MCLRTCRIVVSSENRLYNCAAMHTASLLQLEANIYSFSLQPSGFQVPLEFNRPVSDSDRTPDDHYYCSHCCSLNITYDDFNSV